MSTKNLVISLRFLAMSTLVLGFAYTALVTAAAKLLCPEAAEGSKVIREGRVIGSEWLAQKTTDPRYFWPRPSAADYATVASGGSNQGPLSKSLRAAVDVRRGEWVKAHGEGAPIPAEMLLASGSGLDPHVSPATARAQAARVAAARGLEPARVTQLVDTLSQGPTWGILGEPRVNILLLNVALDEVSAGESHR
jgi:K+-transporting ATPase ATPase C chain